MRRVRTSIVFLISAVTAAAGLTAELPKAPPALRPDDRYKADVLVLVSHPDDETAVTGYLARAIYDERRRVAVVFGTRGDGGGNAMGNEQAASLGAVREIEARRALASFGVLNVWFLGGPDTPGQDVLRSLETWHHGEALARAVRLMRLTRPEVVLTWLPMYVAGENHGDHQAAGVIATEAFDLAGDSTAFPEQLAQPRNRTGISNLTEGLAPWQPKKLYYFSDASHTDFQEGKGPRYSTTDVSPARHVSYARMAAEEMSFHLTQDDTGQAARQALAKGDLKEFEQPVLLIFAKSLVPSSPTGAVMEGIAKGSAGFAPVRGYRPPDPAGISVELGGPWAFYREFWKAHGVDHLSSLLKMPEVAIAPGETLHLPLVIRNADGQARDVTLRATAPEGWRVVAGEAVYPVDAGGCYPVQTAIASPTKGGQDWHMITWSAESGGRGAGTIQVRVQLATGGLPQ